MNSLTPKLNLRSNIYLPFTRVQFISQNKVSDVSEFEKKYQNKSGSFNELDGNKISKFYNELTAEPKSTQMQLRKSPNLRKLIPKTETIKRSKNTKSEKCDASSLENLKKMLHLYAQNANMLELKKCKDSGLNLNTIDSYGWTPLMCAVSANHVNVVEFLIENGADVKIQTPQGFTALDIAIKQESLEKIQRILMNPVYERKIKQKQKEQNISKKVPLNFCSVCKKHYEDTKDTHERSIAHMLLLNRYPNKDKSFYHIPEHNKGYQIMIKEGWDASSGLGLNCDGRKYPIKTILKTDRSCIGKNKKDKERITHFGPNDISAIKTRNGKNRVLVIERERTLKKREREKMIRKNRQKEIDFRRSFNLDL